MCYVAWLGKVQQRDVRDFVESAVCQKLSHAPTLTLTDRKCGVKVSLGDYHFIE